MNTKFSIIFAPILVTCYIRFYSILRSTVCSITKGMFLLIQDQLIILKHSYYKIVLKTCYLRLHQIIRCITLDHVCALYFRFYVSRRKSDLYNSIQNTFCVSSALLHVCVTSMAINIERGICLELTSSRVSCSSEASSSELIDNLEELFFRYYIDSDVYSTTH